MVEWLLLVPKIYLPLYIHESMHDWLRDDRKGKWVLILDNVDDASFLGKAPSTERC